MYRSEFQTAAPLGAQRNARARSRGRFSFSRMLKRAVDIGGALLFFGLFGWLYVLIWAAVAAKQGRPAIYRHTRVGFRGRAFQCLKFRSMIRNADEVLARHLSECEQAREEWARDFKLRDDPRVTSFGRFLRRTSLDELPQFWNVLIGDMSLVGPRPVTADELREYYGEMAPRYLSVKPGITGLWQVSGRNDLSYPSRVALDAQYASHWTNLGDLKILVRTVGVVLGGRGSY